MKFLGAVLAALLISSFFFGLGWVANENVNDVATPSEGENVDETTSEWYEDLCYIDGEPQIIDAHSTSSMPRQGGTSYINQDGEVIVYELFNGEIHKTHTYGSVDVVCDVP